MEKFLAEGVDLKSIRSLGNAGDAHYFDDSTTPTKVREYLDSIRELDTLKGMKWLLAMMSKGRDVSDFFPFVVKNVSAKSVEVKKMVYQYLVHYADFDESCREVALLSVNSFQKDMDGANQLIRGLALRVMTSIRVSEITQIQLLAVQRCASDSSPYVRKCAAIALTKLNGFDGMVSQRDELTEILKKLLNDSSVMVLGSAVAAFNEICPANFDLIHGCYRKLCHLLADLDEWAQVCVLEVLTRYCRTQFTDPAPGVEAAVRLQAKQRSKSAAAGHIMKTVKRRIVKKAFYSDEEDESGEEEVEVDFQEEEMDDKEAGKFFSREADVDIDFDHRLLIRSSLPLLKSRNAGVVMSVCTLHYYCGSQTSSTNQQIGKALVRILRNRREVQYVVLTCINTLAQEHPAIFRNYVSDFYIKGEDPVFNRLLKLEILTAICTPEMSQSILRELQTYVKHGNTTFVAAVVRAVGRIVDADPQSAEHCVNGLTHLLSCSNSQKVVGETVVVLRQLLQQNSSMEIRERLLLQLAKALVVSADGIEEPSARASIIWLIGEFHDVFVDSAADLLRMLAKRFKTESTEAKQQILSFAIKLSLRRSEDEPVQTIMQYVLELARYDVDTDLRDRSRFVTALMGLAPTTEGEEEQEFDADALEKLNQHAQGVMLAPKLPPVTLLGGVDVDGRQLFNLGSLSSLMRHRSLNYEDIPIWSEHTSDSKVREGDKPITYFEDQLRGEDGAKRKASGFYGDEDSDNSTSDSDSDSSGSSESSSGDDDDSEDSDIDGDGQGGSSDGASSDESEDESDDSESSEELKPAPRKKAPRPAKKAATSKKNTGNEALIDYSGNVPTSNATGGGNAVANDLEFLIGGGTGTQTGAPPQSNSSTGAQATGDILGVRALTSSDSQSGTSSTFSAFDDLLGDEPAGSVPPATQTPSGMSLSDDILAFGSSLPATSMINSAPAAGVASQESASATAAPPVQEQQDIVTSTPIQLLNPSICGGLSLTLSFFHGATSHLVANAAMTQLTFSNQGQQTFRSLKISLPSNIPKTTIEEIPLLKPGESADIAMEIALAGQQGKSLRCEVRSNNGTYTANFQPKVEDLLSTWASPSKRDFEALRSKLGGFSASSKTYSCSEVKLTGGVEDMEESIIKRLRAKSNLSVVQGPGKGEIMLSALSRSSPEADGDRILMTISIKDKAVKLQVNCDEPMLCAPFLGLLGKV